MLCYDDVEEVDRIQHGQFDQDLILEYSVPFHPNPWFKDDISHLATEEFLSERAAVRKSGGLVTEFCMPDPPRYMIQNLEERDIGHVWRNGPYTETNIAGFYELSRPAEKLLLPGTYGKSYNQFKQS